MAPGGSDESDGSIPIKQALGILTSPEFLVLVCSGLYVALFVLAPFRRVSSSLILKYTIWAATTLMSVLIPYTLGVMQKSPVQNIHFLVWAVFLLFAFGSVDSLSAYSLEDNDSWKKHTVQQVVQFFWVAWLFISYHFGAAGLLWSFILPLNMLLFLAILTGWAKISSLQTAGQTPMEVKVIAEYMMHEHELSSSSNQVEDIDPVNMKGYHYLTFIFGTVVQESTIEGYIPVIDINSANVVTIEKIWHCERRLLSRGTAEGYDVKRMKDMCLSFALSKLLRRRYFGYPSGESQIPKTRDFVLRGLISDDDHDHDHERVFRVIEYVIIISSDWWKVYFISTYVTTPPSVLASKRYVALRELPLLLKRWFRPWGNKIGQYSLLDSFDYSPRTQNLLHHITFKMVDSGGEGKVSTQTKLPAQVKKAVVLHLKALRNDIDRLTNGVLSLERNGISELSWACQFKTHTQVILVWHIATSVCEIATAQENEDAATSMCEIATVHESENEATSVRETETVQENEDATKDNLVVATSLSRYCAYLIAFAPDLLPDSRVTADGIFDQVVCEARKLMKGLTSRSIYEEMLQLSDGDSIPILRKGTKLGKQLMEKDRTVRWKVMADFWTEMILFVAPSNNAKAHVENLARGGEFVTHLWALLSHAGILEQNTAPPHV